MGGGTDVEVHWFRVRALPARHWNINQRPGRRPRLAKVSHVVDDWAGWVFLHLRQEARAKILTEKLGVAVDPMPSAGPIQNVQLLDSGGAQIGIITMGIALQGWNSTGWTNGKSFRNMRALFPMSGSLLHALALQRSGIETVAQLDDKRIGVGPKASAAGVYVPAIVKVLGVSAEM